LILDVGCGSNARGNVNVDIKIPDPVPVNFIRAGAHFLPFRKKCFDVLFSSHVLEHLQKPLQALKEWARVARSLCIIVPHRIAEMFQPCHEHLHHFNIRSFEKLLERMGFRWFKILVVRRTVGINIFGFNLPWEMIAVCLI